MPKKDLKNSNAKRANGIYIPKYPDQGALKHEEMDYNLDLIGETVQGYRVMGNSPNGRLNTVRDANKVLKLYQVTSQDNNLITAGAAVGDYVWVPGNVETRTSLPVVANTNIGAINAGDAIDAGTSLRDFIEQLVQTTFNPILNNDPSFSLTTSINNLQLIGTLIDVPLIFNFNQGQILGSFNNNVWDETIEQNKRAGDAIQYIIEGNTLNTNTYTVQNHLIQEGTQNNTFSGSVQYSQGPQPKNSENQDFGAPYPAGTSDTQNTNIEGVYPYFINDINNNMVQQPLVSHSVNSIQFAQQFAETVTIRHKIKIPNAMLNNKSVSFQFYNTLNGSWENLNSSEFISSSTGPNGTANIAGNFVNYTTYIKDSTVGGGNDYKIIFN